MSCYKKLYIIFAFAIASAFLLIGCTSKGKVIKKAEVDVTDSNEAGSETLDVEKNDNADNLPVSHSDESLKDTADGDDITTEQPGENRDITAVFDKADKWSKTLLSDGKLIADLDGDKKDDTIQIEYKEIEGSKYIKEFEVVLAESNAAYKLNDYDASFEKLKLFDFDNDGVDELVIMFDTHGAGGQGTHEVYVLWLNSGTITAKQLNDPGTEKLEDFELSWNADGIYDIEKIKYKGDTKFMVRQYVWGDGVHANTIGDILSVISFDKESDSFAVEESWLEKVN